MTTADSNGAPESAGGDDPFAYLYRPAEGEEAPRQPRSSYARPMEVGRAQYGAPAAYQQPPQPPQAPQAGYGQPTTQLPQQSRYAERSRPQPGEERPGSRGKATVIGAVAVIAAIAIGAGIALSTGDPDPKASATGGHSSAPAATGSGHTASASSSASNSPTASSVPISDASKLQAQGAATANSVKGAVSSDGSYLTLQAGSTVTWTVSVQTAGQYRFWLRFNNTGADVSAAATVNGVPHTSGINFKNYGKGPMDPSQSWYYTNIWPQLQAGTNTLTVSVPAGSSGSILLDQVALTTSDQAPWK